ncbi:SDR family oxidoreductase [Psychromarinibacter sp. C21-152]|uniref:SDR family oxidoreductase n=1 Tax=Psychromarinibacter sediminicola TaxID=3033385 RepID=A0AAE3T9V4_9RHOB|nr:SDR family oxidoreductase [Psychromarinibacter sediminicola]MDF0602213.1 SDR family oxidoreductase [Psychromarinibacter sediminicola]
MAQRVLITAGAGGIGLAIAQAFAASGARVHVLDIDRAALDAATRTDGITGDVADVADADAIGQAVTAAAKRLGGLDVLVNNAGIAGPTAPVADYPLADWRRVLDVNLTGTFAVTQAAIADLRRSGRGTILIMSSLAGRFGYPQRSAYASTKWALVGLAKTLAMELGPDGITCNAILPGAVAGARMDAVLAARAELAGTTLEEEREKAFRNQSVRRFVQPEEIAALCLYLAGPAARSFSGQTFPIDGDSRSSA